MKKFALFALPALALAAPAQAQDAGGFRVEGIIAYDEIKADLGSDEDEFNPQRDRDFDVAFGVGLGYDFLRGPGINAGVDVEFTESTAKKSVFFDSVEVGEIKAGSDLYIGGRVTAPISGSFNVVGKLGYTSLGIDFKALDDEEIDDDDVIDDRLGGIRAALGVQYKDPDGPTYYGVEYRYSNYEEDVVRHQVGLVIGARF